MIIPVDDTNDGRIEQWDLTPQIAPYLDRHMVLPLLEFLKDKVEAGQLGYSFTDLDTSRLQLVRPTNMVDYAEDLYKAIHSTDSTKIPIAELADQKQAVYEEKDALESACEKLDKFPAEERAKLILASKWNVSYLNSLGIDEKMIETYLKLARFNFQCGDYKSALIILKYYVDIFAFPPPSVVEDDDDYDDSENKPQQRSKQRGNDATTNYPEGTVIGDPSMYYLRVVDLHMLTVLWGRLACEILDEDYSAAAVGMDAVKTALESLVTSNCLTPLEALQQRTWLMHWSLFVYWNDTAAASSTVFVDKKSRKGLSGIASASTVGGLEQLVELFHTDRYKQTITTNAPHLLRYLTAAVLLCKRRVGGKKSSAASNIEARRLLKNLVYVMQDCEYTDPIVEFVNCLIVKFDFDSAQVKLGECEKVLNTDFFLCHQTDLFMEEARVFVFENYCRIHNKIDLIALGEKLAMDQDSAERWIVDLIRNADLDAKIDADVGCVVMGGAPQSIYEQVMDRTRDLNSRSATLALNLSVLLSKAKDEKSKRERLYKVDDDD